MRMRTWMLAVCVVLLPAGAFAAGAVEAIAAHRHLGVASCSNSVCHGASQVFRDSHVMQNEFAVWQETDPHAKAYALLEQPASREIARKLGLGSATEAKICLDCHADNVPAAQRGERFQLSDGLGQFLIGQRLAVVVFAQHEVHTPAFHRFGDEGGRSFTARGAIEGRARRCNEAHRAIPVTDYARDRGEHGMPLPQSGRRANRSCWSA